MFHGLLHSRLKFSKFRILLDHPKVQTELSVIQFKNWAEGKLGTQMVKTADMGKNRQRLLQFSISLLFCR